MSATRRYIVGPVYDWCFFLLPPTAALLVGIAIADTTFTNEVLTLGDTTGTLAGFAIGTLIHAHLVAVFARSHGNPRIFRRHPIRFVLVPLALWLALAWSVYLAAVASIVATFWDVWHSGAQTFGLARIYERNHDPHDSPLQRRLDFALNQLLYAGPILGGATLMAHLDELESFGRRDDLVSIFLSEVPAYALDWRGTLTGIVLLAGTGFVLFYVAVAWLRHRRGYRVSPLKTFLVASTGLCAIYTWGFNSWGEAFFIMNLFHAVQYLALVWAKEKDRIAARLGLGHHRLRRPVALACFLGATSAYGLFVELHGASGHAIWAMTLVVSLMHFWYDAFVWSVRRADV